MGEAAVCSEEGTVDIEVEMQKGGLEKERKSDGSRDGSSSVIRWERFLPRTVLRVLLVEADDSTRQIISALLRKCSYKVATVPDGLKAWEVLKGRPHNIDLILTEEELPLISGFSLLTLIMEHDICKNIPVIMMSSHDSVSTVYKCMLRGAAGFLMKPIRINELKNLWQHVWRRQSSINGLGPQDESIAQQKVEATAENNAAAASDHSSGSKAFAQRQEDYLKKGSDVRSSCTKPDMEAESANVEEDAEDISRSKHNRSHAPNTRTQELHIDTDSGKNLNNHENSSAGPGVAVCKFSNVEIQEGSHVELLNCRKAANNLPSEAYTETNLHANASREAIDLIGTFKNSSNCSYDGMVLDIGPKMFESPELNLSLTRFEFSGCENYISPSQKHTLVQSNGSAFSRYVNKQSCPSTQSIPSTSPRESQINSVNHSSDHVVNKSGVAFQDRLYPIPVPIRGVDSLQQLNRNCSISSGQNYSNIQLGCSNKPVQKLDSLDDKTNISSATDLSGSGSFYNGITVVSQLKQCGSISGSDGNCNVSQSASLRNSASESGNKENFISQETNSQWSIQREAALTKFRLKRKERCFEKKVRYESRKKLAEQRPRVKGQFVRQVPPDGPRSAKPENSLGNSAGGLVIKNPSFFLPVIM